MPQNELNPAIFKAYDVRGLYPDEIHEAVVHDIEHAAPQHLVGRPAEHAFRARVEDGDRAGKIGVGYGRANEVPDAIKKSTEGARKHMFSVKLKGDTIPHEVFGAYDGGKVLLKPAVTGTGLIAGGAVRAVLEAAGVKNVLTKSMGSSNHIAVVNATVEALLQLKTAEDYANARKA